MKRLVGPVGLVLGAVLGFTFNVLYRLGHGPTEINEHGQVLGLTNDTWSHLGLVWVVPLALGVAGLIEADPDRRTRRLVAALLVGLALEYGSTWVFALYVPAHLLLAVTRGWLAMRLLRSRALPAWSTTPTLVALALWLWLPIDADAMYDFQLEIGPWSHQYEDLLAVVSALSWVALGLGLRSIATRPFAVRTVPAPAAVLAS